MGHLQFYCRGDMLKYVVYSALSAVIAVSEAADDCKTPDGKSGVCQNVYQCKPLIQLMNGATGYAAIEKLKGYECGWDVFAIKVCCPSAYESDSIDNTPHPPDVSSHRNLRLLNTKICGISESSDKIINGQEAGLFEFPWMALLSYETSSGLEFLCGGTILNERYILTAAHCVKNLNSRRLAGVRVGEYNVRTPKDCETYKTGKTEDIEVCADPVQDLPVEEIVAHSLFTPRNISNDIALLRLAKKIDFGPDNVKPVCLPLTEEVRKMPLTKVIVAGWGRTETAKRSDILMKVALDAVQHAKCVEHYVKQKIPITHRQLCAFKEGKDSCDGDSGGPLHALASVRNSARYVQFGIVSFGPKLCAVLGIPAVYTKVAYYMDWILDNMKA